MDGCLCLFFLFGVAKLGRFFSEKIIVNCLKLKERKKRGMRGEKGEVSGVGSWETGAT